MNSSLPFTRQVQSLPAMVPFTSPEQLERAQGKSFELRLGANESPFGPSPRALQAMLTAVNQVKWYGDPESFDLRRALTAKHGVPAACISIGSGIDDLLGLIVRVLLEPGDAVVTSQGAYPTFQYHVVAYGGQLVTVPYLSDFRNDLDGLIRKANEVQAKLVYLANPDNPTGTVYSFAEIQAAVQGLPPDCVFLLDEAYIEFAPAEIQSPDAEIDPRIVRFRTFSKVHGMAGARIGYIIADEAVTAALNKVRLHFGIHRISQAGALASLSDAEYLAGVVAETARGRDEYMALAIEHSFKPIASATNFVLMDVGGMERAQKLVADLAEQGVFIRTPGAAPLNRCIRVTVGTPTQRKQFAAALERC